jgi:CheY-like chemotaxis protein
MQQMDQTHPLYQDLTEVQKAAERSASLTRQLLGFARKQTVCPRVLDLNETIEGMLIMLRRLIGEDIILSWRPDTKLWPVKMDPSQIDQILANLCINARDAIQAGGKVIIETKNRQIDHDYCLNHPGFIPGEYVLLTVGDDGCGMDKEIISHLFEPFFTTKGIGKGTGLGLATIYGIVKQNNGFIDVYSEPGQGSIFHVYLPRYLGKIEAIPKAPSAAPLGHANETILLVEDEPAILKMIATMLQQLGYKVLTAPTPAEAIRLASESTEKIDLIMTDVIMPEMNGRELADTLSVQYPAIKHLFMSGYTADVIVHHGVLEDGVHFIQKPFSKEDLSINLRKALGKRP